MKGDGLGLHAAVAVLFAALSLASLARDYDGSAFTYVVLAERGEGKAQAALAHPLYLPALRGLCAANPSERPGTWCLRSAQTLGVLGAAAFLFLLQRLCLRWSGDPWASAWAALAFAAEGHFWAFSHQAKPYSLAAALGAAAILASGPGAGPARGAAAGLLAGLAMGMDLFNAVIVPSVLWLRRVSGARREEGFGPPFLLASSACLLACAWSWAGSPDGSLAAAFSPPGMRTTTLFHGNSPPELAATAAAWLLRVQAGALWMIPLCLAAARRRGSGVLGPGLLPWSAAHLALTAAALVLLHARDNYAFFAWLGLAPLAASAAGGSRGWRAALGACSAGWLAWNFCSAILPRSRAERQPIESEAAFLRGALEPQDVLLVAGAPDWRLAYLVRGAFRVLRLDQAPSAADPMGPARPRIDPAVWPEVASALSAGRRVWLAADSLCRPEAAWGTAQVDAYQRRAQDELLRRHSLDAPRISPFGQWYVPVRARRPR